MSESIDMRYKIAKMYRLRSKLLSIVVPDHLRKMLVDLAKLIDEKIAKAVKFIGRIEKIESEHKPNIESRII